MILFQKAEGVWREVDTVGIEGADQTRDRRNFGHLSGNTFSGQRFTHDFECFRRDETLGHRSGALVERFDLGCCTGGKLGIDDGVDVPADNQFVDLAQQPLFIVRTDLSVDRNRRRGRRYHCGRRNGACGCRDRGHARANGRRTGRCRIRRNGRLLARRKQRDDKEQPGDFH